MLPKISVIIPAHNSAGYIERLLVSLKRQTFSHFEVIVVDDASSDGTAEVASRYCRVVRMAQNRGAGAARNVGVRASKGNLLAFLDADCVVVEDWLEKLYGDFERNPEVSAVASQYRGSVGGSFLEKFAFYELKHRELKKYVGRFVDRIFTCNFACRRQVFLDVGGFSEGFGGASCEDIKMGYELRRHGHKILWDESLGVYHLFRSSLRDYLRQQFKNVSDNAVVHWTDPGIAGKEALANKVNYAEILFSVLALLILVPAFFLRWNVLAIEGTIFLSVVALNSGFLMFLAEKEGPLFSVLSLPMIFARNCIWAVAVFSGIKGMLFR